MTDKAIWDGRHERTKWNVSFLLKSESQGPMSILHKELSKWKSLQTSVRMEIMKTKGIRILDKENNHVSVDLTDILMGVADGNELYWSILFIDAIGHLGKWGTIPDFEKRVNDSEKGLFMSWEDLNELSNLFEEIVDIIIIASPNSKNLKRYQDDEKMYQSCDIVIVKFDSSFWEVFSNNPKFIEGLSNKFNKVFPLQPNFQNFSV